MGDGDWCGGGIRGAFKYVLLGLGSARWGLVQGRGWEEGIGEYIEVAHRGRIGESAEQRGRAGRKLTPRRTHLDETRQENGKR